MITGDNGLIEKAGKAKNDTEKSQVYEEVSTAVLIVANSNKTFDEKKGDLAEKLKLNKNDISVISEETTSKVKFTYENYNFTANLEDGDIELSEGE